MARCISANGRFTLADLNAFVSEDAESAAKHLLEQIGKLRGKALGTWKQAHRRVFDLGVQAGDTGRAFEEVFLSTGTLRRIAAVGGQIQVTVYPAERAAKRRHG